MATKIFWRFCWQDICSLRWRLAALPPQYIVVRKRIKAATMSNSMSENADWPVAQSAKQRQSSAGQRPLFGPRFIPILYFIGGGVAIGEMVRGAWCAVADSEGDGTWRWVRAPR